MLIKYFVVENMLIKYIFLYPCTCLKIWLNAKPRNALLDNCQIESASRQSQNDLFVTLFLLTLKVYYFDEIYEQRPG